MGNPPEKLEPGLDFSIYPITFVSLFKRRDENH